MKYRVVNERTSTSTSEGSVTPCPCDCHSGTTTSIDERNPACAAHDYKGD